MRRLAPVLALCLAGCEGAEGPRSEIVVVVDSDYSTDAQKLEVDTITIEVAGGGFVGNAGGMMSWIFGSQGRAGLALPAEVSVLAQSGAGLTTDVTAKAWFLGTQLVERRALGVRSVAGRRVALRLPLLRSCACQGTNCPAGPDCENLTDPPLEPY